MKPISRFLRNFCALLTRFWFHFFLEVVVTAKLSAQKHLRTHALLCGSTGAGKSKLMELLFYDLQRKSQSNRNCALVAIDPHGDFAKRLLYFCHNSDKSRLVYISSSINTEAKTKEKYT